MSPSRTADPAQLHGLDFLVSAAAHALVVGLIALLALWEVHRTPEPMPRLQVSMITPAELDRMIRHASQAKPAPHAPPKPSPKARPRPKTAKTQPRPSPAAPAPTAPRAKAKAKRPEKPFDPFAPLESKDDRSTAPSQPRHDALSQMQVQQMSKQELNRYIAMIQTAVERQWKVPMSLGHVSNPLVELQLNPNGSIASIRILEGSGDATLDASLSRAIEAAAPFQLPARQFEVFRDLKIRFVPLVNQQR